MRADGLGSLQAVVALWEILARQEEIPESQLEPTLQRLIEPFADANKAEEVLDAALQAVQTLLSFAPPEPSSLQEKMIGLLAAPPGLDGGARRARDEVAERIRAALDAQRLVPLDTLFTLAEQLERAATTQPRPGPEFFQLASRLKELNLPNPFPTAVERRAAFFGYWAERHINAEREADLAGVAKLENPEKLARALGLLAPHLRDTLVGLVYAYYAPPGAMVLHHNPLFVRSHDFLGDSGRGTGKRGPGPRSRLQPGLALERRRSPHRLAFRRGLCVGRCRKGFPGTAANPVADLGRPGSADAAFLSRAALVACLGSHSALGGTAPPPGPGPSGRGGRFR